MSRPERQFWKTLTKATLGLGAVVGLYLTAASVKAAWAFWLVLALGSGYSVTVVLIPRAFKRSVEYANRVGNYPKLLQLKVDLEGQKEALLVEIDELRLQKKDEYQRGVSEGVRQAWGAVASRIADTPVLTNAIKESDGLILVATCEGSRPLPGARYLVAMRISGSVKGVVEVRKDKDSSHSIQLVIVQANDEKFWLRVNEKAELEDNLPDNIHLIPYEITEGEANPLADLVDEEVAE
ncbi:hypothetical protein [Streptomyces sp. PTY087I2]|uniref:hypothetical protein n=1 Tax=Streptomyces sp. PTY087I2 TaxID=1819298 RepID=UPI00114D2726|nr:hypothetical protein [Streptomyces sp. PTY087I2]